MASTFDDDKSAIYDFLKPAAVKQLHADHVAGKHDNHKILFSIIVLEEWLRGFLVTSGDEPERATQVCDVNPCSAQL